MNDFCRRVYESESLDGEANYLLDAVRRGVDSIVFSFVSKD